MKSKPPTKKIKIELNIEGVSSSSRNSTSSPTSSTSSLLSIPPPTSGGGGGAGLKGGGGTDMASVAKAVTSGMVKTHHHHQQSQAQPPSQPHYHQQSIVGLGAGNRTASSPPAYPTYIHSDIKEWPKLNVLINCPKGSDGKPAATLGPEGIMTMDDLDSLQAELETLWSAMACRIRSLKVDQATLQNSASNVNLSAALGDHFDPHHQEKINAVASLIDAGHGTRTSVSAAAKLVMGSQQNASSGASSSGSSNASSSLGGKKTATPSSSTVSAVSNKREDKLPKKKLKGEAGNLLKKGNDKPTRATQNRSHSVSSDFGGLDGFYKHEFDKMNEFWDFADNYCGEIKSEDIEELEKVIEEHGSLPVSFLETPPLGKHFRDGETHSTPTPTKGKTDTSKTPKRLDACGPLTQRLVSALVDERVAMFHNQRSQNSPKEESGSSTSNGTSSNEPGFVHRTGLIKALGLDGGTNRPPMENQLRECLLERGFLHSEDANDPILFDPEDEILVEIRRTQNTLKKLHNYNSERLKELHTKATRELERSVLKEDLDAADKDVIEAYKTIVSLKQKKKPITKREKEFAIKSLEARDKALQKLSPTTTSSSTGPTSVLKVEV